MAIVTNFGTTSTIDSALRYGSDESKLGDTIALNCSKDNVIRDFNLPYEINNRENDKVKLHRFVLSFANDNNKSELNQHDSSDYVRKFINNLSDHLNNDTSIICYEHMNTGHNHYHIYLNSLGIDGKKLKPKQSLIYLSRKINDNVAKEYHLRPIQSYRQNAKQQFTTNNRLRFMKKHDWYEPYSYYDDARQRISRAIFMSHNLSEFKRSMTLQGLGVENNFLKNTKTGSVDIKFRHKNWELEPNRFRKVRTRTLGSDFEKSSIKRAITNPSDRKLMYRYREYASPKRSVQGGQLNREERKQIEDRSRQINDKVSMKGVSFKDDRLNIIRTIKGEAARTRRNSRKIDANSVHIKKQESVYRRHAPKIEESPKARQPAPPLRPSLNGLSQREREQVLEDEKFFSALSDLIDELTNDFKSIFYDREEPKRHHSMTKEEFRHEYVAREKEVRRKQAREREYERGRQQSNSEESNSLLPNEQRKRYNKLHSNNRNHHINFH